LKAAPHPDQDRRLAALAAYEILDTEREAAFDEVVALVSQLCDAPIAVVNFIDAERQWFKAEVGLGVRSMPLDTSLCSHVILEGEFVEIPDTLLDMRMQDNPLCLTEPGLRFYAGATLRTADGLPLGTLCVLDYKPRSLTPLQRQTVQVIARQVMRQLELRVALRNQDVLRREIDHRVKNSLASVAAIVALQASRSPDQAVRDALAAVQTRLAALVSLHEQLHRAADGASVRLDRFVETSAEMMRSLLADNVSIDAGMERATISPEQASLVGNIVNEFVANSAKHAFPNGARGAIRISGTRAGNR
jgi:two-component sensor histidine kinase